MAQMHFQQRPIKAQSPMEGFRVIFVALFCVFLLLAMVGQVFFLNWRTWLPGAEERAIGCERLVGRAVQDGREGVRHR